MVVLDQLLFVGFLIVGFPEEAVISMPVIVSSLKVMKMINKF